MPSHDAAADTVSQINLTDAAELSPLETEMLTFEREWWSKPSGKEAHLRARFGMSTTQYHQVLNTLIDKPAALAADPLLIGRLQHRREARRRA